MDCSHANVGCGRNITIPEALAELIKNVVGFEGCLVPVVANRTVTTKFWVLR